MNNLFLLIFLFFFVRPSLCVKLEIRVNDNYVNKFYPAKVKDSLKLTCKLLNDNNSQDDSCTLEWKRQKDVQNNYNRIRPTFQDNEAILEIASLQRTDAGQYFCVCGELNLTAMIMINVKYPQIPYCGPSMFICEKSEKCIAQHYVCDGKIDCKYGEDEHFRECGPDPCIGKIRHCRDGRCIPTNWCCNIEIDPNCTVKERPACCRQQFKLVQDHPASYNEYYNFKHGLLKATIFTLFVGAVLFFFLVTICLLVLCRIHIHSCPVNQDIREVCSRTRIPFYDFYLYLNRNWNNLDHSCVHRPQLRNALYSNVPTQRVSDETNNNFTVGNGFNIGNSVTRSIPRSILLMSYLNNQVQYVNRPGSPPPYSQVCDSTTSIQGMGDPPPPYVSRENLTAGSNCDNEGSEQEDGVMRRGYVLVTTHSDDEHTVTGNLTDANGDDTSCAIFNTPTNNEIECSSTHTEIVEERRKHLKSLMKQKTKKFDIKKLRQEFLGVTATATTGVVASSHSDSECSTSEFDSLIGGVSENDNNNIFKHYKKNNNSINNITLTVDSNRQFNENADVTNLKLRETHVHDDTTATSENVPVKHPTSTSNSTSTSTSTRPKSLICNFYLPSRSQEILENIHHIRPLPLIKCHSGNMLSEQNDYLQNRNKQLTNRHHSIADLSPSSNSNEYHQYFEIPIYDRESPLLTLPLRESFIGLRKD